MCRKKCIHVGNFVFQIGIDEFGKRFELMHDGSDCTGSLVGCWKSSLKPVLVMTWLPLQALLYLTL